MISDWILFCSRVCTQPQTICRNQIIFAHKLSREREREIIRPEQRRKAISIDATVRKITKYFEKGWSQVNNSLVFVGHVLRIIFIWEPKEPLLCGVLCACFAFFVRSSVRIPTTLTIVYAPRVCTFFLLKFVYILFFVWTRVIAVH